MAHEIFISYSTADKPTADAVCHALESAGLRCWIAPRDAAPGRKYQGSIIRAIRECRAMVLLFSAASNSSEHVFRELYAASEHSKPVVPFRIEDVPPSDDLAYYLGPLHWLDALTAPLERHIERLVHALAEFARQTPGEAGSRVAAPPPPDPTTAPPGERSDRAPGAPDPPDVGRESVTQAEATDRPRDGRGLAAGGAGHPTRAIPGAWLWWGLACGVLAATIVYALEAWRYPSLLAWLGSVLRYTAMFVGLAMAVRLKGFGLRAGMVGAVSGWVVGLIVSWLYWMVI
jgi:hypothetical protein